MLKYLKKRIFFSHNDKYLKNKKKLVDKINQFEGEFQSLSDEQLKEKTNEFRQRIQEKKEDLFSLIPEAFAVVKNACRRLCGQKVNYMDKEEEWNMIPYDVQLLGAIAMAEGNIAEMQTGEGKTLTASMPLYLHSLTGKNVQLVTTNDFLAKRDAEWIGTIFRYLGLSVGCLQNSMSPEIRKEHYNCDVTYGTNSEFGFDYLRDMGMAMSADELVQRNHYYAIVDEIDSILIDEARTPLIISGPTEKKNHFFKEFRRSITLVYKKQQELCKQLLAEAKKVLLHNTNKKSTEYKDAIEKVTLSRIGLPKNKELLQLLENPLFRKSVEKYELSLLSDTQKKKSHELKKNLFFVIDERSNEAYLTEKGQKIISSNENEFIIDDILQKVQEVEDDSSLTFEQKQEKKEVLQTSYNQQKEKIHTISQLLKAYALFSRDVHYIVQQGEVIIVDEHTGYPMPGRRFSSGLHQALEAKENVPIERENQTLASITIQNYFRLYEKLAGMTGTAETESVEFSNIYKLDVICVPTHKKCIRIDKNDRIFLTKREKYNAIIQEIKEQHRKERPILVGTPTVSVSETISQLLKKERLNHRVLNARRNFDEAKIIASAGEKTAITIATNMAGRGTDIKLGKGVKDIGGLFVIAAARHDARRIDRQLRGRCARQGDPGESIAFISLEDDLMRLFGSDKITGILSRLGLKEGEALQHRLLNMSIERAQKKVELQEFSARKRVLEYDDIMNKQREIVYKLRKDALMNDKVTKFIFDITKNLIESKVDFALTQKNETRNILEAWAKRTFPFNFDFNFLENIYDKQEICEHIFSAIEKKYKKKTSFEVNSAMNQEMEKFVLLSSIDKLWKEHLSAMDQLRQNVQFSFVAQKDPLTVYKYESFTLFQTLEQEIANEILLKLFSSFSSIQALEGFIENSEPKPQIKKNKKKSKATKKRKKKNRR